MTTGELAKLLTHPYRIAESNLEAPAQEEEPFGHILSFGFSRA
jgi:hypothetical protein